MYTYSIWRGYHEWEYLYKDKNADLMQIVMVELPKLKEKDGEAAAMLYKLFNETQNIVSEVERVTGVTLLKARKGVGTMVDYEGLLEEANAKAIRSVVEVMQELGQEDTVARSCVLKKYPDVDLSLLDRIISEVYNLQQV